MSYTLCNYMDLFMGGKYRIHFLIADDIVIKRIGNIFTAFFSSKFWIDSE